MGVTNKLFCVETGWQTYLQIV